MEKMRLVIVIVRQLCEERAFHHVGTGVEGGGIYIIADCACPE